MHLDVILNDQREKKKAATASVHPIDRVVVERAHVLTQVVDGFLKSPGLKCFDWGKGDFDHSRFEVIL